LENDYIMSVILGVGAKVALIEEMTGTEGRGEPWKICQIWYREGRPALVRIARDDKPDRVVIVDELEPWVEVEADDPTRGESLGALYLSVLIWPEPSDANGAAGPPLPSEPLTYAQLQEARRELQRMAAENRAWPDPSDANGAAGPPLPSLPPTDAQAQEARRELQRMAAENRLFSARPASYDYSQLYN
jgi:hypothetical protein